MAKILIVDDNLDMLDTLEHLFMFYDFEVIRAGNGAEAIKVANSEKPSVIVLDGLMPVMTGFEACEVLKKDPATREIPIVFLSANYTDDEHRELGFELGADEYMLKPFNAKELIAKVQQLLHHRSLIERLRTDNQLLIRSQSTLPGNQLKRETTEIDQNQVLDQLTGLYNNTNFLEKLHAVFRSSSAGESELSLLVIDVDHFKQINAAFGEYAGDYVLMQVANVILTSCSLSSSVFRLGRNRFSVLFDGMSASDCFYEAERIRAAIGQTAFFEGDFFEQRFRHTRRRSVDKRLTASIGLAVSRLDETPTRFLRRAEQALLKAKAKGRNMTLRHSEIIPENSPES